MTTGALFRRRRAARPRRAALVASCLTGAAALLAPTAVGGSVLPGAAGHARTTGAAPGAVVDARTTTSLSLTSQTPWLTGKNDFTLGLGIDSPLPETDLSISINVFPRIESLSAFETTVSSGPPGSVLYAPPPIPLDNLPSGSGVQQAPAAGSGTAESVTLTLPVTPGYATSSSPSSPSLALDNSGDGVYPLQISIVNSSYQVQGTTITTFLVYAEAPSGRGPLRVAWVVPLGALDSVASDGSDRPSPRTVDAVDSLSSALGANPSVNASIELYGATADAIASMGGGVGKSLTSDLQALGANPSSYEFLRPTYVPVDPTGMIDGGVGGELQDQFVAGEQAVKSLVGVDTAGNPYGVGGALDPNAMAGLAADGVGQLVMPSASVSGLSGSSGTLTQPVHIAVSPTGGTAAPVAVVADPVLEKEFAPGSDPALSAQVLLANLAFIFFEEPYDPDPRGVLLTTPAGWTPDGTFLGDFTSGLQTSPILQTLTVSQFLSAVPVGGNDQPGSAVLTPASSSASATFDVSAIAAARSEIAAFDSFAPGLVPTSGWMARTVLASEASGLSSEQRSAILAGIDAGLADEASQISIPSGRIVTLTSSTGEVPVTIDSRSKTPLHVILALSNPALGLRFPKGTEFPITLLKGSTVTSIEVGSRTSGVFALRIELLTPSGHLLLGHGDITVRSTVLSGLAIGLSAGALLLLVVWWIRSGRRRRRERTAPRDPGGPEGQDGTGNTPEADTERSGVSLPDDDTPDVRVEHPLSEAPAGR